VCNLPGTDARESIAEVTSVERSDPGGRRSATASYHRVGLMLLHP
jgi:hypothetical protein